MNGELQTATTSSPRSRRDEPIETMRVSGSVGVGETNDAVATGNAAAQVGPARAIGGGLESTDLARRGKELNCHTVVSFQVDIVEFGIFDEHKLDQAVGLRLRACD